MKNTTCMYCNKPIVISSKANSLTAKCQDCHKIWHKLRTKYALYGKGVNVHDLVFWYINQPQECFECKSKDKLTIDRINPGVRGGLYELDNIQLLCYSCNTCKKRGFSSIEEATSPVEKRVCLSCGVEKPLTIKYFHKTGYKPKFLKKSYSLFHPKCKECRLKQESARYAKTHNIPSRPRKVKYRENYPLVEFK